MTTPATEDTFPFQYAHSPDFPAVLDALGASLLVTTYQANKLVVIRAAGGRLSTLLRGLDLPMGLAIRPGGVAVGCRRQVWFLGDAPEPDVGGQRDSRLVPVWSRVTGDVRGHDLAWAGDDLWLVNTRFSCLCTLGGDWSFVPRWRPPFLTALAPEDRCHLNGLAVREGVPRYATALGATNTPQGWRQGKANGGVLLDVASGATLLAGLSMPHSPRWHDEALWLLESGTGRLLRVDPAGKPEVVAELPGFPRGLCLSDRLAFVALSKIRETSTFGGLPLAARRSELRCGVWVIELATGRTVAVLEFQKGIEELFAVELLPGRRFPDVLPVLRDPEPESFLVPPTGTAISSQLL